jgi:hypothetical protein
MLLMLLAMLALYSAASLLSAMTVHPALKKPWRALKLRIRASTTNPLAALSGKYSSDLETSEATPVDEEKGGDEDEDETLGLMGFEITMS